MAEQFHELFTNYFEKLDLYTNAITKAHGKSHPEAFKVRELFEVINKKVKNGGDSKTDLKVEFTQLREVTANYAIPEDVCETYAATYRMLSELDHAYQA